MTIHRVRIPIEVYAPVNHEWRWRVDYAVFTVEASDATDAASKVAKALEWLVAGKARVGP